MGQIRLNFSSELNMYFIVLTVCLSMTAFFIGCSCFTYSSKTRDPEMGKEHRENVSFYDVLTTSEREGVDIKTDNARIRIGKSKTTPDPNSIKAITEGVVEGVAK